MLCGRYPIHPIDRIVESSHSLTVPTLSVLLEHDFDFYLVLLHAFQHSDLFFTAAGYVLLHGAVLDTIPHSFRAFFFMLVRPVAT